MNDERENFDTLRRLLKVKRYEQPPPRYFNEFSGQVLARISAGEQGGTASGLNVNSWVESLLNRFGARPAVPAAFGGALCALLMAGVVFMDTAPDQNMDSLWTLGAAEVSNGAITPVGSESIAINDRLRMEHSSLASAIVGGNSNTNVSGIALEDSLFGRIQPFSPKLASDPVGSR